MRSHSRVSPESPLWLLGPPVGTIVFLLVTRTSPVTAVGVLYAFLLLLVPWASFLSWRQQNRGGLPVFAMLGFVYWWWFAVGMFWLERTPGLGFGRRIINTESVDDAILLALVGVVCMGVGMRVRVTPLPPLRHLELEEKQISWHYVRFVLVAATLVSLAPGAFSLLGSDGQHIMSILSSTVPTVAFLLLLRKCLTDKGSMLDRTLLWVYFPVRIVSALASGWLGFVVGVGFVCGVMYFLVRRKIPLTMVAVSVVAVLFLQVGKKEFRNSYWEKGEAGGVLERATSWLNGSASKWSEALNSTSSDSTFHLSSESLERTSLLPQVSHVLDVTPSQIPFQGGQTYSYMLITLIPRFVWPDKPSVNDANRYYQLAFGLSTERTVKGTNIGAGCLAEAYINFGWPGVICIMFVIGIILGIYERSFLAEDSSTFFLAIGVALLPGILGIEAQMSAYLGGVIQTVLLTILVFLPVLRRRSGKVRTVSVTPRIVPVMPQLRVRRGR
jgi:oligosaccharide repeat unit polymerase